MFPFEGLSPRARGNLGLVFGLDDFQGPIPACAGEPIGRNAAASDAGAYPRVRGGTSRS